MVTQFDDLTQYYLSNMVQCKDLTKVWTPKKRNKLEELTLNTMTCLWASKDRLIILTDWYWSPSTTNRTDGTVTDKSSSERAGR